MQSNEKRHVQQSSDQSPMPTDLAKAPQVASSRPQVKPDPQFPKKG